MTAANPNYPMDESFFMKLYSKRDEGMINSAHIVIRREVLEVRRTMSGKVFFQCAHCKHLPRGERARLSRLAPQNVGNLYRAVVRFIINHVSACEHIPDHVKALSPKSPKVIAERQTRNYWVENAMSRGLMNGEDGKSIIYCRPATATN